MSYLYRGVTLEQALVNEFGKGEISGVESMVYSGRLTEDSDSIHAARGTPLEELPWWVPEGSEDKGYHGEATSVTGGVTDRIGTAYNFSGGIPLVLFLDERSISAAQIRYDIRSFDGMEGVFPWVYGESVNGEIRDMEEGLVGLTTMTETGPAVWRWGRETLKRDAMQYEDERELIALSDGIPVEGPLEDVVIPAQGRQGPNRLLADFDGYYSGYRDQDATDVSQFSTEEAAARLRDEVAATLPDWAPDVWVVGLEKSMLEHFWEIHEETFGWAYDGERMYDYSTVPDRFVGTD
jgi:hypothetical protein